MVEAPQDVFSAIPTDAQIQRVAGGIVALPDVFALLIVTLDNRVAQLEHIGMRLLGSITHGLVRGHPVRLDQPGYGLNSNIGVQSG